MKYHIINHKGLLAVADEYRPDYDSPILCRLVYASKHKFDDRYDGMPVIPDGKDGTSGESMQVWHIRFPTGSTVSFLTNERANEYQQGQPIQPPRKKNGKEWRWEAGKWVNHNPNI